MSQQNCDLPPPINFSDLCPQCQSDDISISKKRTATTAHICGRQAGPGYLWRTRRLQLRGDASNWRPRTIGCQKWRPFGRRPSGTNTSVCAVSLPPFSLTSVGPSGSSRMSLKCCSNFRPCCYFVTSTNTVTKLGVGSCCSASWARSSAWGTRWG